MRVIAGIVVALLPGCAMEGGGGGAIVGRSGSTSETISIAAGATWSRSWPVAGDYTVSASFASVGGKVDGYLMTEAEFNRWQSGAAPESLTVIDKKLDSDSAEMSGRASGGSTLVLAFVNKSDRLIDLKWWGSFDSR